MSTLHKWRLFYLCATLLVLSVATVLIIYALRQNINLFYTPYELRSQQPSVVVRLGGEVKRASISFGDNLRVKFVITDYLIDVDVQYRGILPDLFREGQSVVAKGKYIDGIFYAEQILAKHDENYTPPELIAKPRDN